MKSTKHSAIGIGLFLSFCGCQRYGDSLDQQALRTQCHIPAYAKLTNYEGFPQVVGFGQREGLRITGYFEIPKSEIGTFEKSIQAEAWMPLPIPADLLLTFPPQGKGLERLLEVADGFFRCHTAGDSILDRLVHNAHRIELQGPSMRKSKNGKSSRDGDNTE
jgi:hypothetical protein